MSKFKIGDTIHYMESNKAQQKELKEELDNNINW